MWNLRIVTIVAVLVLLTIGAVFNLSLTGCNTEDNQVDPMNNDTRVSETTIPAIDATVVLSPVSTSLAAFSFAPAARQ